MVDFPAPGGPAMTSNDDIDTLLASCLLGQAARRAVSGSRGSHRLPLRLERECPAAITVQWPRRHELGSQRTDDAGPSCVMVGLLHIRKRLHPIEQSMRSQYGEAASA